MKGFSLPFHHDKSLEVLREEVVPQMMYPVSCVSVPHDSVGGGTWGIALLSSALHLLTSLLVPLSFKVSNSLLNAFEISSRAGREGGQTD